ncbi:lasso peptide biosynthesis B2 protein [Desulfosediminicola ganghwensis]|uniref:lasso peptide biosynthesis B2 protein n=1 Tax=Desulfosediminicola ganghwensis TaxID=2569540 RepID=UPI0010AC9269|nr:lasso peptide biosynthesis B2 protein [Desulfosediminicola ganghwensis]
MFGRIKRFAELDRGDRKLFLEAYLILGIMRTAILILPFKRITRSLIHRKNLMNVSCLAAGDSPQALSVGMAVRRAANYTPWQSACLAQSLTVWRMLQRRNIPGIFFLGVARDTVNKGQLRAHSWSRHGDAILTGKTGHEDFTVVSAYSWGDI